MKIGIVNPYSWDVPGGVGFHIRDLALKLRSRGHDVQVLTPSTSDELPEWITSAGSSVSIPFNGSVANISVKPTEAARNAAYSIPTYGDSIYGDDGFGDYTGASVPLDGAY